MFRIHTGRIAATLMLLSTTAIGQTAFAASYLDTVKRHVTTNYTASLIDMTRSNTLSTTRTLDWQQPSVELTFELPPSERTSEIILTLSADPLTRVAPNAPLQVQLNNSKPMPIRSNGNGFEARLPLDAKQVRGRRNVLRISYPTPAGAECVSPDHGAWSIDLAQSSLRIKGRAKKRNMSLSEVSEYLDHPALTPKKVGLIARGSDATDMQALAAQGLSLRTPNVPQFSVSKYGTDFNIIMVKRSRLFEVSDDPMILDSKGPRIFVPRGNAKEIIFTADTDAEILEMLDVFATRKLPDTRRAISSLGEMDLQRRLDSDRQVIEGKAHLSDLEIQSSDMKSGEKSYQFSLNDPISTNGELMLRVATTRDIAEESRLRVSLNGKTLGATKLDKKRKSVAFDIQPHDLKADSNILTVSPDFAAKSAFTCPSFSAYNSGFSIGKGSRLTLAETAPTPLTSLEQLTSTGGLFAQSESYIALPKQTGDFQAALGILGRMAKASGQGFTLADYSRTSNLAKDKHVLIIGPSHMTKDHLTGAPKAFRAALSGRSSTGQNLLQANYGQSASLGDGEAALKYAAAQSSSHKINGGGVAALYNSGDGRLIGVISATPGTSFSRASQNLVKPSHWNALQGGVARWTSSSVMMAQTAQSDAGISRPKTQTGFEFPDFGIPALEKYDFYLPEFEWPEFDMPEFDLPTVSLPEFKWPSFSLPKAKPELQPVNLPRGQSISKFETPELGPIQTAQVEQKGWGITPRLKPALKPISTKPASTTGGLRGSFQFANDTQSKFGSFQDIRRDVKAKWSATKQWFKTKKDALIENRALEEVAISADRLQDQAKPAGRSIKAAIADKLPGKGLVQLGDRTVSVYGLILILAFGLVLLLMSLASPASRLGGRH